MRPLTIAVDVDEVCAQLLREWIMRYNARYEDTLTLDQVTEWDVSKCVKAECGMKVFDILHDPNLYDYIPPYPDAVKAINFARDRGHRVVFVTSCPKGSMDQKLTWLEKWGFLPSDVRTQRDFIAAHDKSLIQADVLIDDAMHNVDAWPRVAILINRPHNAAGITGHYRANSLMDAMQMINRLHPMAIRLSA
jgi:5'-nucleotidase